MSCGCHAVVMRWDLGSILCASEGFDANHGDRVTSQSTYHFIHLANLFTNAGDEGASILDPASVLEHCSEDVFVIVFVFIFVFASFGRGTELLAVSQRQG